MPRFSGLFVLPAITHVMPLHTIAPKPVRDKVVCGVIFLVCAVKVSAKSKLKVPNQSAIGINSVTFWGCPGTGVSVTIGHIKSPGHVLPAVLKRNSLFLPILRTLAFSARKGST